MTLLLRQTSPLLGCLAVLAFCGSAGAGEYGSQFGSEAARCSAYGPEFAPGGGEACAHIGSRVRVQLGTNAGLHSGSDWAAGKASSATLHSDGTAPRAATPSHLRIQGGLEYPNPFH